MTNWICLASIAEKVGTSKQAVSQYLKRVGLKPVRDGGGPRTHWYDIDAVKRAYREHRYSYNFGSWIRS